MTIVKGATGKLEFQKYIAPHLSATYATPCTVDSARKYEGK